MEDRNKIISSNGTPELDNKHYPIRLQTFQIGYLDERNGLIRSVDEIKAILNSVCTKYGWDNKSIEYGMCYAHYQNGKAYYKERINMFTVGLSTVNPEHEFCYVEALGMNNLDPDIKKIIESYSDFDYEMKIYEQEQRKIEENKRQR